MTELTFMRALESIYPADDATQDYVRKLKHGERIHCDFKKQRNPKFHRKGMALLTFLFEHWEPAEISNQYGIPEKDFDRFRKDLTILAGFYKQTIRLNGEIRTEAESISFSNMDDEKFERWYSAIINVGLKHILKGYDRKEVDRVIDELMSFA